VREGVFEEAQDGVTGAYERLVVERVLAQHEQPVLRHNPPASGDIAAEPGCFGHGEAELTQHRRDRSVWLVHRHGGEAPGSLSSAPAA